MKIMRYKKSEVFMRSMNTAKESQRKEVVNKVRNALKTFFKYQGWISVMAIRLCQKRWRKSQIKLTFSICYSVVLFLFIWKWNYKVKQILQNNKTPFLKSQWKTQSLLISIQHLNNIKWTWWWTSLHVF